MFLGNMPTDPLVWAAFGAELPSETVEISNYVHKTGQLQELAKQFCLTTFNFAPTPQIIYSLW